LQDARECRVDLLQVHHILLGKVSLHGAQHDLGKGGKSDNGRKADEEGEAEFE